MVLQMQSCLTFDKKFDFDWWCDMMDVPLQKRVKLTECMMKTSLEMQEFLIFNMKIIKLYRFILKWHCLYVKSATLKDKFLEVFSKYDILSTEKMRIEEK